MSNLETRPREAVCGAQPPGEVVTELLEPRKVWLGKTTQVRRLLPHKDRRMVGAWCFVDHYGPDDIRRTGMRVPPHPHTGLQTVSWLFDGEVLHRDSLGSRAWSGPAQLNLMTAGPRHRALRGVARRPPPDPARRPAVGRAARRRPRAVAPRFAQHRDLPVLERPGLPRDRARR